MQMTYIAFYITFYLFSYGQAHSIWFPGSRVNCFKVKSGAASFPAVDPTGNLIMIEKLVFSEDLNRGPHDLQLGRYNLETILNVCETVEKLLVLLFFITSVLSLLC